MSKCVTLQIQTNLAEINHERINVMGQLYDLSYLTEI